MRRQQWLLDPLDLEIQAFEDMRDELEAHHHGRWVVFTNGHFWRRESFKTFQDASRAAREAFGSREVLIREVGAPQEVRLPSSLLWLTDEGSSGS